MAQGLDFDLKQTVVFNGSFGPREIEQLTEAIAADYSQFKALRDAVGELQDKEEHSPASMVRLGVCLYLLRRVDDARDALQDAFVKTWQNLSRFDLKRRFAPWFFQILRNQCRDALRSRKARFRLEALDERLEMKPGNPEDGPERRAERKAAKKLLWKGLERLSEDHREVLVLKEIEGFRYGEIARILNVPEGTVASRLFHARRALAEELRNAGVTYP